MLSYPILAVALHALLLPAILQAPGADTGPAPQLEHARELMQTGQFEQARDAYEAALGADPSNLAAKDGEVSASEKLALAARAQHDNDTALKDLLRAQQLVPDSPRLLFDLGVLEDEMHLYRDADTVLARLQAMQPSDPNTIYAVARVKTDLGQLGPAEEAMRAYLKQKPDDPTAHYGLGRIFQLGQHPDEARAEFEHSVALRPEQTESYYQLGDIALGRGQYEEAIAEFAKTLHRKPAPRRSAGRNRHGVLS